MGSGWAPGGSGGSGRDSVGSGGSAGSAGVPPNILEENQVML